MKLDDLIQDDLQAIKQDAIKEFENLKEIGQKINNLQEPKWLELRAQCMSEAKEFFENGRFELECHENRIISKRNEIIIDFKDDSQEERLIFPIKIEPLNVYQSIEVRPCLEDDHMFCYKNNLEIKKNPLFYENYTDLINKCNDKDALLILIENIRENINHYQNTISRLKEIKYVYSILDRQVECSTFKEVFEKYVD